MPKTKHSTPTRTVGTESKKSRTMPPKGEITMKLLIDKKSHKVLFAEAGKECADFLFHLLALPVGTVVRCLTKEAMVGSLGQLYDSFEALGIDYLDADVAKECLLDPKVAVGAAAQVPLLMIQQAPASDPKPLYGCSNSYGCSNYSTYVSDDCGAICPSCRSTMGRVLKYVGHPVSSPAGETKGGEGGYVKGVVTYMIMDDLTVKPMSTISSITLLNKFNVKDVGCLQEKVVKLDMNQGLALLKASLMSKTVLTDVFLGNKGV